MHKQDKSTTRETTTANTSNRLLQNENRRTRSNLQRANRSHENSKRTTHDMHGTRNNRMLERIHSHAKRHIITIKTQQRPSRVIRKTIPKKKKTATLTTTRNRRNPKPTKQIPNLLLKNNTTPTSTTSTDKQNTRKIHNRRSNRPKTNKRKTTLVRPKLQSSQRTVPRPTRPKKTANSRNMHIMDNTKDKHKNETARKKAERKKNSRLSV